MIWRIENIIDEIYRSDFSAIRGGEIETIGPESLVGLRYFGPEMHRDLLVAGS